MSLLGAALAWSSLALVLYVFAGYPVLLWLLTRFVRRPVRRGNATPTITLLISAFNEEETLAAKLDNTLQLDYPKDRLEVIVISDASTDRTDEIVKGYAPRGITLLRMPNRGGKTAGLNAAAAAARGELLAFSDANILYMPDLLRRYAANFDDPEVGCVTGDSRYATEDHTDGAHEQETSYWNYERVIRKMESTLGSTVGGDGAIFCIRRDLYRPLAADAINDLVIPLQIVCKGYRNIYDTTAAGVEPSAGSFEGEFRRKRRIVNRSWRAVMNLTGVLNPFRVGVFSWQVISHKVLRWLVLPILVMGAAGCALAWNAHWIYPAGLLAWLATVLMALAGKVVGTGLGPVSKILQATYYFYLVNIASVIGIWRAMFGKVDTIWSPERGAAPSAGLDDRSPS